MTPTAWAILLFIISLLLVCLEAFIPSAGVLGLFAGGMLVWSIYKGFVASMLCGVLLVVSTVIALPLLFVGFVKWWPLTPLGKRMLDIPNRPEGEETYQPNQSLLSKQGTAVTDLLPNGRVTIDGTGYDVVTEGVLVDAGTRVEVSRVEGNRITVRPVSASPLAFPSAVPSPANPVSDISVSSHPDEVDPFDDPLA